MQVWRELSGAELNIPQIDWNNENKRKRMTCCHPFSLICNTSNLYQVLLLCLICIALLLFLFLLQSYGNPVRNHSHRSRIRNVLPINFKCSYTYLFSGTLVVRINPIHAISYATNKETKRAVNIRQGLKIRANAHTLQ